MNTAMIRRHMTDNGASELDILDKLDDLADRKHRERIDAETQRHYEAQRRFEQRENQRRLLCVPNRNLSL